MLCGEYYAMSQDCGCKLILLASKKAKPKSRTDSSGVNNTVLCCTVYVMNDKTR